MTDSFQAQETQNVFETLETESSDSLSIYIKSLQSQQQSGQETLKRILNQRNSKNQTALHVVCLKHHLDKTRILLEAGANPNVLDCDKQTPAFLVIVGLQNCNCAECTKKAVRCLSLLSYYGGIMEIPDAKDRTPLFLCAEHRFVDCARTLILNGCALGKTPTGDAMIDVLVDKIPGILETVFDCAVKSEGHNSIDDPEFKLTFDLGLVVPYQTCSTAGEMKFLKHLVQYSKHDYGCLDPATCILRHPVVAVFLDIKWKALQCFYVSFLVYQFLALLAYTSVICVTVFFDCPYQKYSNLLQNDNIKFFIINENNTLNSSQTLFLSSPCRARTINRVVGVIISLNAILLLSQESHRACMDFKDYAKNMYHYLSVLANLAVIFTASIVVFLDHTSSVYSLLYPASAFAISILWCQIFVIIGRMPKLSIYVEMLVTISGNFCKTMAIYSFLLLGFAISFCILFHSNPQLYHFPLSLTKLLSMLVGELDHETLLNPSKDVNEGDKSTDANSGSPLATAPAASNELSTGQHVMAYFWYVAAVIMVTLVLMNLLIGLAVSDIQSIRENAEIYVIKRRIRYIAFLEKIFLEFFGERLWSKWKLMRIKEMICPVELRSFTIAIYPHDENCKEIARETRCTIQNWLVSSDQESQSNILRKCKGASPDSSSTLTNLRKRSRTNFSYPQHPQSISNEVSTKTTETDRLAKLERTLEQLNEKMDLILAGTTIITQL